MKQVDTAPLYAAITLGSNSFSMLVAQTVAGKPKLLAKYRRKVRLADGINDDGLLDATAFTRGLACLKVFAKLLDRKGIAGEHLVVIATATLRKVGNANEFCQSAQAVLAQPIEIITGLREAELIYQGMNATSGGNERRLVIDVGGASTEFVIGQGDQILLKISLPIGCVTFDNQFFRNASFSLANFELAQTQVAALLADHRRALQRCGWHRVVGASGAIQAVIELLNNRRLDAVITLDVLRRLRAEVIVQPDNDMTHIEGLHPERASTFAAGIAILLALFSLLEIQSLHLSTGALREGVLHALAAKIAGGSNKP